MSSSHSNTKIGFAGDGWGAISALKGLLKSFAQVEVCSKDPEVLNLVPKALHRLTLEDISANTVVFSGYKPFVSSKILDTKRCINIHYSLLPKYRGLHSTVWAILNDEAQLGYTIHEMDEEMDNGDLIHQRRFENDGLSSAPYYMRLFNDSVEAEVGEIMQGYLNGTIVPAKQDHKQATWVTKRGHRDCQIDFTQSAKHISNLFRCLQAPYPYPFVLHNDKEIEVRSCRILKEKGEGQEGQIVNKTDEGLTVKSSDQCVLLSDFRYADGQSYALEQFKIGEKLNQ